VLTPGRRSALAWFDNGKENDVIRFLARLVRFAVLALVAMASPAAFAQSSATTITLQGRLAGVADGTRALTVRFYAAETGGTARNTVSVPGVTVSEGVFTARVPATSTTLFDGQSLWWTVSVDGGPESGRQLLTTVPYSKWSERSATLKGQGATLLSIEPGQASPDAGIISFGDGSGWKLFMSRRLDAGGLDQHWFDDRGNQWSRGNISAASITVRGADLAERFDVAPAVVGDDASKIDPRPGMVVSIDPSNPGRLMVSSTDHDTKVAGVISGANGLDAGVVLGKGNTTPTIDGEHPVAMSGRVWVYADESNGVIRPGDRLTTSGVKAGQAMRVADDSKAAGCVIGKAMTGVDAETGMVLVLVNLQ
jgi:hypothetical protein